MKNFMAGLLALTVIVPAAQVKQEETQRGHDALVSIAAQAIADAAAHNKGHAWVKTGEFNFAQAYELQRDLETKGYVLDISAGRIYISW